MSIVRHSGPRGTRGPRKQQPTTTPLGPTQCRCGHKRRMHSAAIWSCLEDGCDCKRFDPLEVDAATGRPDIPTG